MPTPLIGASRAGRPVRRAREEVRESPGEGPGGRGGEARPASGRRGPVGVPGALWALVVVVTLLDVVGARHLPQFGQDFRAVWEAGRHVLHGQGVYEENGAQLPYLYPPPSAVLVLPLALLPYAVARWLFVAVVTACLGLAGVRAARFSGRQGPCVAPVALLAVAVSEPAAAALSNLNVSALLAPVVPVYLHRMAQGRERSAGILLGLSFAVKPLLVPLLLVPLLLRRPRALVLPIVIPAVLTLLTLPLLPDRARFFTRVLPLLVSGGAGRLGVHNISIQGVGTTLGWPTAAVGGLRVLVGAAAVLAAVLAARAGGQQEVRLAEVTGLAFLGLFLAGGTNEDHYALVLLALVASVLHGSSHVRHVVLAAGVAVVGAGRALPLLALTTSRAIAVSEVCGLVLMLGGALLGLRYRAGASRRLRAAELVERESG